MYFPLGPNARIALPGWRNYDGIDGHAVCLVNCDSVKSRRAVSTRNSTTFSSTTTEAENPWAIALQPQIVLRRDFLDNYRDQGVLSRYRLRLFPNPLLRWPGV